MFIYLEKWIFMQPSSSIKIQAPQIPCHFHVSYIMGITIKISTCKSEVRLEIRIEDADSIRLEGCSF